MSRKQLRPNQSGPVAQLGARFHGMEEVVGSIPTRSTKSLNGLAPIAILIPLVLTCDFLPVLPVSTCLLHQARLELFKRRSFGRVLSMSVDVHGQSGVGVAQDALSSL